MKLELVNERIGFWSECGLIDFDKGNLWPRQYHWACGCVGVSFDGDVVMVAPCSRHPEFIEMLPEGIFDADDLRRQLAGRVRPFERFKNERRGADGIAARDRVTLLKIFDKGKHHGRQENKGEDRRRASRRVPDPSDSSQGA